MPWDGTPSKFVEGLGTIRSAVRSQSSTENEISNNLYLSFKKNFGAHNLKALAGFRLNSFSYSDSYLSGYNNQNDKMPNMSLSLAYLTYGGANDKWIDLSYYLNAGYNYKNRYFLNAGEFIAELSNFQKNCKLKGYIS